MSNFDILEKLGEGSYSVVHKVHRKTDDQIYAAKKVKFNSLTPRDKQNTLNEIRILSSITHPNIVGYKEVFIDESTSTIWLIMDYAAKGDLLQIINVHQKNKTFFTESQIWSILVQAVKGLKTLHSRNILHRDIKCANIFLTADNVIQLGDLNVAKVVNGLAYTQTGTPYYASPEVWKDCPYDSKSDIWSLGCVLYELCALQPAFKSKDMKELYAKVTKGKFSGIPSMYSNDLLCVIKSMLQVKPALRPSCEQLLEMPIVKRNINTEEYSENTSPLIKTIKVPLSLKALKTKLPGPMYQKSSRAHSGTNKIEDDKENFERKSSRVFSREPSHPSLTPSPFLKPANKKRVDQGNIFRAKPLENHSCNQSKLQKPPKNPSTSFI